MRLAVAIAAVALVGAACGGNDLTGPVESRNAGGVGNQSLLVRADVDLDPMAGGFLTRFEVDVLDRFDQPVSDADVTIVWNYTSLSLVEEGTSGTYTAELNGSGSGTLVLNVEKGDSLYVRDVKLGNIGIHAILDPQGGDTVAADSALPVRWVSDVDAPFATLSSRDDSFQVMDSGEFVIPDSLNQARSSQWLTLLRYNEVQISGGLRGSYFRMEVRRASDSFVVRDPG
jgi:hypothetical protein